MALKAKDIAKQIGVSEATLSLVINGKPGISEKTRMRVEQQLRELGYESMLQSRGGKASDSRIIGIVVYKNKGELIGFNSFFSLMVDGVERTCRRYGYTMTIINVEKEHLKAQLQYVKEVGCAGYAVFATELHEAELQVFEEFGVPFVIFDNEFLGHDIYCVKVNNKQGSFVSIRHLVENGHRRIGYLSSGLDVNSFHERKKYAFDAMDHFGIPEADRFHFAIGYPDEDAAEGMHQVLQRYTREELPTAFYADNDVVAVGAIEAIKEFGYRVPEDFSVIGYDDRPICEFINPKLTTVQLPRDLFGEIVIEQLNKRIHDRKGRYTTVAISGTLVRRGTVSNIG